MAHVPISWLLATRIKGTNTDANSQASRESKEHGIYIVLLHLACTSLCHGCSAAFSMSHQTWEWVNFHSPAPTQVVLVPFLSEKKGGKKSMSELEVEWYWATPEGRKKEERKQIGIFHRGGGVVTGFCSNISYTIKKIRVCDISPPWESYSFIGILIWGLQSQIMGSPRVWDIQKVSLPKN